MALADAHEGYEYQDLLTVYFILAEMLSDSDSVFHIDRKEFANDKLDDLRIVRKDGTIKRQVKYSNAEADYTFAKSNISADSGYQLSVDSLYRSWLEQPDRSTTSLQLCLAWNEPVDDLKNYLLPVAAEGSFPGFATKLFRLNAESIWPSTGEPASSWRRLRSVADTIDRALFGEFCEQLQIEVELPKFSLDLSQPGPLEKLVLAQSKKIGIGVFPNDHLQDDEFILKVLAIVRRARSKSGRIEVADIFHQLNIKVDYGHIEQKFPVVETENIERIDRLDAFVSVYEANDRIILTGEPGSGKSWFLENLQRHLEKKDIRVIRHYCYTQLDDTMQKERIKVNTFYGNLIYDVLKAYPKLKAKKEKKYASNLDELNILLSAITEPTWLIIDGLDHIERIFRFRKFNDMGVDEIAIIDNIRKLVASSKVKILVASQNIPQLEDLTDFTTALIAPWEISDVKALLKKQNRPDTEIKPGLLLSDFILTKSGGNPLYIKYILEEWDRDQSGLESLPAYSFNLTEYYQYLVTQLSQQEDVPQVLSGVNFSLDTEEIRQITHSGDFVDASLRTLAPILKTSLTQTGYIIYHESFRRFMIDRLQQSGVSVEKKVFLPVVEWFDSKNLFTFNKAYRYCLPYYFDNGFFEKIVQRLDYKFVTDSVVHGYPWLLIESNYRYFVKAACRLKDYKRVILLNEIDKIISSTYHEFKANYSLHIRVVGEIYGFNHVSSLLSFEDGQFYSFDEGLEACSICYDHKTAAPWEQFIRKIPKGTKIELEWFAYWIRGLLVTKNTRQLLTCAKQLQKGEPGAFEIDFRTELKGYQDTEYVNNLAGESAYIKKLLEEKPAIVEEVAIETLMDRIAAMEDLYKDGVELTHSFFNQLKRNEYPESLQEQIIQQFKGRNWFFNWIIYYSRIIWLQKQGNASFEDIRSAFQYLVYNTEPFLGKPRVCDLYQLHSFINSSIRDGLDLLNKNSCDWSAILEILVKVSDDTTTSLQRSAGGPLEAKALIEILVDYSDSRNAGQFLEEIEKLIDDRKDHRLHSDIADYAYIRASFYNKQGNKQAAIASYEKAVEYALSYTMRKDQTLDDAVYALPVLTLVNKEFAIAEAMKVRTLVESVVDHTDGKTTQYYPLSWTESLAKIDVHSASLYLLHSFVDYRFDWRAESSLVDLFSSEEMPDIDPVVLFYLCMSQPTNHNDKFTRFRLGLYDKLVTIDRSIGEKLFSHIEASVQPRQNHTIAEDITVQFNKIAAQTGLVPTVQSADNDKKEDIARKKKKKTDLSKMSHEDMLAFIEKESSGDGDLSTIMVFLQGQPECTEQIKEITRQAAKKQHRMSNAYVNDDLKFASEQVACHYWVCRFVYDMGNWFERFVNLDALLRARKIDKTLAEEFLFEELPSVLDIGFNAQFSSNLLKALVSMGADAQSISEIWQVILVVTTYRLPFREDRDWADTIKDELGMSTEEVFVCMVISRFRTASTERVQYTISALAYLMRACPDKLVKPIRWFFNNRDKFLVCIQAIMLQFLLQDKKAGGKLYEHFTDVFRAMLPQAHFQMDYFLSQLLDEPMPSIESPEDLIYPPVEEGMFGFFIRYNRRYHMLLNYGLDMEQIISKYLNSVKEKFGDLMDLYSNSYPRAFVSNIYPADYVQEIINKNHFEQVEAIVEFEDEEVGPYLAGISLELILVQVNSLGLRPGDLQKPFDAHDTYTSHIPGADAEWVRLGHYEKQQKENKRDQMQEYETKGGIVFPDPVADARLYPYSSYIVYPFMLWGSRLPHFKIEKTVVFTIKQKDCLEACQILWLNPVLVDRLGLQTKITQAGLIAETKDGEKVLQMRTWRTDYLGHNYRTALSEMVPQLEGTELLIRKDYFEKLCSFFQVQASYRTVAVKPGLAEKE